MYTSALLLVAFQLITHTFCANILLLSGIASPSHHMFNRVLGVGLAAKHNVTFLSGDLGKTPVPNLHYIHLERVYAALFEGDAKFDMLDMSRQSPLEQFPEYSKYFIQGCEGSLTSKGLDVILNYPDDFKFDVVIHDFTMGFCLLPLIHKFNYPPLISLTAFSNPPFSVFSIGGHKYPAYIPHYLMDYPEIMSFTERAYNLFVYGVNLFEHKYRMFPVMERLIKERYNFKNMPTGEELERRTALMLINSDFAVDFPEPIQPNMIQIGGLQIAEPKPLSEEMEKFIASAKKGTILMSLGTNMKSALLGDELLSKIINTFAQLPDYNFLWKFEEDPKVLPVKLSKNVMVQKFMPQNDILAHPRILAFVSHSGLLSSHEALYHGTPIIGMPFYADQFMNIAKMIRKGVGAKIDFQTLTTESFKQVILSVVENPKYAANSKKISKLFQDKPMKPLDTALWWVDYVIRNPNLDHMKSPTLEIGFFVANSLDILLAAVIALNLFAYIICKVFKKLFRSGKSKKKTE